MLLSQRWHRLPLLHSRHPGGQAAGDGKHNPTETKPVSVSKPAQPLARRAVPRLRAETPLCLSYLPDKNSQDSGQRAMIKVGKQFLPHFPCTKLMVLTCALALCLVCMVSLPTFGNTGTAQEEERGWAEAALVCLVALKAGLVTL